MFTKILSLLNEHNNNPNLHQIAFQIFKKLVMGLGLEISFDQFFLELQLNEETYLLALQCTIQKLTLFLKHKPNDIQTNVFSIHARLLRETNINAQFILNPYITITYCTFYLTKVDKYMTREM
jgi:hypothetical protein